MGSPTLLEFHFVGVKLHTHWVAFGHNNFVDKKFGPLMKVSSSHDNISPIGSIQVMVQIYNFNCSKTIAKNHNLN